MKEQGVYLSRGKSMAEIQAEAAERAAADARPVVVTLPEAVRREAEAAAGHVAYRMIAAANVFDLIQTAPDGGCLDTRHLSAVAEVSALHQPDAGGRPACVPERRMPLWRPGAGSGGVRPVATRLWVEGNPQRHQRCRRAGGDDGHARRWRFDARGDADRPGGAAIAGRRGAADRQHRICHGRRKQPVERSAHCADAKRIVSPFVA